MRRPSGIVAPAMGAVARRSGLSLSQTYTVATGAVVALVLAVSGLPPVLGRDATRVETAATASPTTTVAPTAVVPAPVPRDEALPPTGTPVPARFTPPPPAPSSSPTTATTAPEPRSPAVPEVPGTTRTLAAVPQPGAPEGIGVAPDGTIYVATNNALGRGGVGPSQILAFSPQGQPLGSWAAPDQPEQRTIGLTGLVVDDEGRVLVADGATSRVLRLDPARSQFVEVATIPDVTTCLLAPAPCEPGLGDSAPELRGLALRADGSLLIADRAQGIVWHAASGEVEPLLSLDDRLPGEGPFAVVEDDQGFLVTVTRTASSLPPGAPAVMGFDRSGSAATIVSTFETTDAPTAMTIGASGRVYVTLSGANAVVSLDRADDRQFFDGGTADPGFDSPTGITVIEGAILVTSQSTTLNDAARWIIHRMAIADTNREVNP